MKTLILAAALTFTSATTFAESFCETIGKLAYATMDARQAGVPLMKLLELPTATELGKSMAMEAYESPRFHSESMQERAKTEFQTKWELLCVKARAKKGSNV